MFGSPVEAIWLGVVQGLTEFLPVSSSGHLALVQAWFGHAEPSLALSVMVHAGTLLSTLIFFRRPVLDIAVEVLKGIREPSRFNTTQGGRDAVFIVVASIPTAIIGLLLRDWVERLMASHTAVAICFLVTGVLLLSTLRAPSGSITTPSWKGALLAGAVQGLAVFPGISRSGSTITAALWMGVRRERAFELSMLMSVPAVLGALLLELGDLSEQAGADSGLLTVGFVGGLVSFVVGLLALFILQQFVKKGRLAAFALWVVPLGIALLIWQ